MTPEDNTPAPDAAVQEAAATATFVEDAETGAVDEVPSPEPLPDTIVMQPDDPAEPAAEVTQPGNVVAPEAQPVPEAPPQERVVEPEPSVRTVASGAPKVSEINAEMNAGAARVQEHENRERMLAQKRAKEESGEVSEEKQVGDATEANKDL